MFCLENINYGTKIYSKLPNKKHRGEHCFYFFVKNVFVDLKSNQKLLHFNIFLFCIGFWNGGGEGCVFKSYVYVKQIKKRTIYIQKCTN